jgi:hypothetical protein
VDVAAAERLVMKLREFRETLDGDERELLAILLAPGIAQAFRSDEVTGYAQSPFAPLPQALADALRQSRVTDAD